MNIKLISSRHLENEYFCFDFEKPKDFIFKEGQYCLFELNNKELIGRKIRAFSIASTSDESIVRIATRIVEKCSDYKVALKSMKTGEEISVSVPKGEFILETSTNGVFIAGGIGITPIRSMLLSKTRNNSMRKDVLIYSELEKCYPFKKELETLPNLTIHYAADVEPTQKLIISNALEFKNTVFYYVSGSPGFVNGISNLLMANGVQKDRIRYDSFIGY